MPPLQVQAIWPTGGVPTTKGVEGTATTAATGWEVQSPGMPGDAGVHPAGIPAIAAAAAIDVVGSKIIVSRPVDPPAGAVKVAVIFPVVASMAIDETLPVACGADHPAAKAEPLAAFSATASFAPPANTTPSLTRARIV